MKVSCNGVILCEFFVVVVFLAHKENVHHGQNPVCVSVIFLQYMSSLSTHEMGTDGGVGREGSICISTTILINISA